MLFFLRQSTPTVSRAKGTSKKKEKIVYLPTKTRKKNNEERSRFFFKQSCQKSSFVCFNFKISFFCLVLERKQKKTGELKYWHMRRFYKTKKSLELTCTKNFPHKYKARFEYLSEHRLHNVLKSSPIFRRPKCTSTYSWDVFGIHLPFLLKNK